MQCNFEHELKRKFLTEVSQTEQKINEKNKSFLKKWAENKQQL